MLIQARPSLTKTNRCFAKQEILEIGGFLVDAWSSIGHHLNAKHNGVPSSGTKFLIQDKFSGSIAPHLHGAIKWQPVAQLPPC